MSTLHRRTLLTSTVVAGAGGLLAACGAGSGGGSGSGGAPKAPAGSPLVPLADVPVGGAVSAEAADGTPVLVARPSEQEAVAFSAVCTHQGCTVAAGQERLQCPCHGSAFAPLTGEVVQGPAERALDRVPVEVVDGQVVLA